MGVRIEGYSGMMRYLERGAQRIVDEFQNDLQNLGKDSIVYILNNLQEIGIANRTGNLRSSIGFVVVKDGRIISRGGFERVDGPDRAKTSVDGSQVGQELAESLARNYPKGYALIVVVGMEYAVLLQSVENKDILASGEIYLKKELKKLVAEYNRKYGKN